MDIIGIFFLIIIIILAMFGYYIRKLENELSKTLKILGYYSLRYGKQTSEEILKWLEENIDKIKK